MPPNPVCDQGPVNAGPFSLPRRHIHEWRGLRRWGKVEQIGNLLYEILRGCADRKDGYPRTLAPAPHPHPVDTTGQAD